MNGRVVGLSNRISSMLVPATFMEWANKRFANSPGTNASSRVVIRTKDPGNPMLVNYLKENGLTTDADKTRFSRYRQVVDFVVNISGITGMLLLAFALLIFTLFIQLTIASCKDEIALLVLKQLKRFLMIRFYPPNIWIVTIGLILISATQYWLFQFLKAKQIILSPFISGYTVVAAVCILLVIAYVNNHSIRKWLHQKK
jgi:cell division protein FtsX